MLRCGHQIAPFRPVTGNRIGHGGFLEQRQVAVDTRAGPVIDVARRQHMQAGRQRMQFDMAARAAFAAQPVAAIAVGQQHIEGPVGGGVEIGQRFRRQRRIGMVQRIQHQLAPAALAGGRAQCADPVQDRRRHAMIVEAEPASARQHVEPGCHVRPVFPVPGRRLPGPAGHLVPVGGDQDRPVMAGTMQQNDGAHGIFRKASRN